MQNDFLSLNARDWYSIIAYCTKKNLVPSFTFYEFFTIFPVPTRHSQPRKGRLSVDAIGLGAPPPFQHHWLACIRARCGSGVAHDTGKFPAAPPWFCVKNATSRHKYITRNIQKWSTLTFIFPNSERIEEKWRKISGFHYNLLEIV